MNRGTHAVQSGENWWQLGGENWLTASVTQQKSLCNTWAATKRIE